MNKKYMIQAAKKFLAHYTIVTWNLLLKSKLIILALIRKTEIITPFFYIRPE